MAANAPKMAFDLTGSRMKLVRTTLALFSFASVVVCLAVAQSTAGQQKTAPAAEPEDISGMYSFEHEGEFVQITIEPRKPEDAGKPVTISGFVSRYGDLESDRGVFLDHFFSRGALENQKLAFTTKTVHGIW